MSTFAERLLQKYWRKILKPDNHPIFHALIIWSKMLLSTESVFAEISGNAFGLQ